MQVWKTKFKSNTVPVFYKARVERFAFKNKVDLELDKVVVITKIENSHWGSLLVLILKPGGNIRLCANYKYTLKYTKHIKYTFKIYKV